MAKAKQKAYLINPRLQNLIIWLAVASVLTQVAVICYWIIRQYPTNHNLSGYLLISVYGFGAPLIFFLTAVWLRQKQGGWRARVFDGLIYAAMGMIAADILNQSTTFYQQFYIFNGGYWRSILYSLIPWIVAYIIYVIFLWRYGS